MRRYTILGLATMMLILSTIVGILLPADADRKNIDPKLTMALNVYTTLPAEMIAVLSEAYERENKVRVNFIPMSSQDILKKIQDDSVSDPTIVRTGDLILADSKVLRGAAEFNLLTPFSSETNDGILSNFKDEQNRWVGVWYDPIIFCMNRDFVSKTIDLPDNWEKLADSYDIRVGMTDFLTADAASNLMFQLIDNFGEEETYAILSGLHKNVIHYVKYLSNPVRQAGMGEVDISIAVESEALRYINDGYPLRIIYPADGTSYQLTGVAIMTKDDLKKQLAMKFADWLLGDEVQLYLQTNGFYFIPTNPRAMTYKTFAGKNLLLLDNNQNFSPKQQREYLDRWVKEVRLSNID